MQRIINDLKKYTMYSLVSAKSQLKSEVSNSYLNWMWWILEPICFMLIYVLVFGGIFGAEETNFPVFIFIGITIWDFFNRMCNVSVKLIRNNKAIVSKVYLPKYILLLTKVWVYGFKMLISMLIAVGMLFFYRIPLTWNVLYIVPILMTLMVFSYGVGILLMHFGVFLDDLSNVVSIVLRAMFYLTGIFYDISTRLPAPYGYYAVRCNPIAFFMKSARDALMYGQAPDLGWLAFWAVVSVVILYCAIQTIYRNENTYVKVL